MNKRRRTPVMARGGDPRGQVLVLFALMLIVLLLVSALAVDYGGWLVTKRNYQNVSDAASLAGAQQLTRSITTGKQQLARQAAWQSIKTALNFSGLNPAAQADTTLNPSSTPYQENGYKVWVASPPSDAGSAYVGHVSGPGVVYVRIDHAALDYLSRIVNTSRNVAAWSTAGRFPANFAVIGMCSPTSITANCLAGDANIKLDGTTTNLIVNTGDLGTNRWVKDGGSSSGVALGSSSNAYMQLFDTCWGFSNNQCQLWGSTGTAPDLTVTRSAIPLGAPIQDPSYAPPTISSTATPNQCAGTGSATLASATVFERPAEDSQVSDLPIRLASAVQPVGPQLIRDAVGTNNDLAGIVTANVGGAALGNINVSASNGTTTYNMGSTPNNGGNKGTYSQTNLDSGTYTITATDPNGVYAPATATVIIPTPGTNTTYTPNPDIKMQKYPTVSGTIRSSAGGTIAGATISITGAGGPYPTTSGAGGTYGPVIISGWGASNSWLVNASATNYASNSTNTGQLNLDTDYTNVDVTLTPAPASVAGTVTDRATNLPIPYVRVTLSTGQFADTDTSGNYTIASATPGSITFTLTSTPGHTSLDGYLPSDSESSHPTPYTTTVNAGSNTGPAFNFAVWPKDCLNTAPGDWKCGYPAANYCGATQNGSAANVTCSKFDQTNAIRPGTYHDIIIDGCAWIDPTGGATGLGTGQSAGVIHVTDKIQFKTNNSYLFGDGVTIVMNSGTSFDAACNGCGFVLNYGTHKVSNGGAAGTCDPNQDFSTPFNYGDSGQKCFRTVSSSGTQDYAYAAWGTQGHTPWTGTTYNDSAISKGQELGITFFLYCPPATPQCGLGSASRFVSAGNGFGFQFNGVMYGPGDDINIGGGSDAQTAAGQIVGWTIEYHGGTRILQNWYGDPVDGQPFLIEPVLGE